MLAKTLPAKPLSVADLLLAWYDRHRRELPWRAPPGETADPYRVWLSEVMLQQTTVATVRPRFAAWTARWPDLASLAAAAEADVMAAWAGLGYYARARNLLATARAVTAAGGAFPETEAALRQLPGLGAYTAAAVAAIAFGERAVVVDANVERVVARLRAIGVPLPAGRATIRAAADALTPDARAGDFAQAMMDLGATVCTSRKPRCLLCPLREGCAGWATGAPERFPVKAAKKARPLRYGTVFWLERRAPVSPLHPPRRRPGPSGDAADNGAPPSIAETLATGPRPPPGWSQNKVLLVKRPAKGLLGGMRALPTGAWADAPPGLADAPAAADWRLLPVTVRHGFTHFELELALAVAGDEGHGARADGEWWPVATLASAGLPTVFARAAAMMEGMR